MPRRGVRVTAIPVPKPPREASHCHHCQSVAEYRHHCCARPRCWYVATVLLYVAAVVLQVVAAVLQLLRLLLLLHVGDRDATGNGGATLHGGLRGAVAADWYVAAVRRPRGETWPLRCCRSWPRAGACDTNQKYEVGGKRRESTTAQPAGRVDSTHTAR